MQEQCSLFRAGYARLQAVGIRERNRDLVDAAIRDAARQQIRIVGGGALSVRAVAREVGMVSSAVYRYYPTREALLTALILESYASLAVALEEEPPGEGAQAWRTASRRLREWAVQRPHEFQLIYGTPIPDYTAPPDTIPLAARIAQVFLSAAAPGHSTAAPAPLAEQLAALGGACAAAPLAAMAELIGMITLELGGHFVGTADPTDHLYEFVIDEQITRLGLSDA